MHSPSRSLQTLLVSLRRPTSNSTKVFACITPVNVLFSCRVVICPQEWLTLFGLYLPSSSVNGVSEVISDHGLSWLAAKSWPLIQLSCSESQAKNFIQFCFFIFLIFYSPSYQYNDKKSDNHLFHLKALHTGISLFCHGQPSDIILIANTHPEGYTVFNLYTLYCFHSHK